MRRSLLLPILLTLGTAAGAQSAPPGPLGPIDPADLLLLVKLAPERLAKTLTNLSQAADLVITEEGLPLLVSPLSFPFPAKADPEDRFSFSPLEKPGTKVILTFKEIKSVHLWEDQALQTVEGFGKDKGSLSDLQMGEWLVRAALRFNQVRRPHPPEGPDPWKEWHQRLQQRLLELRAQVVRQLPEGDSKGDWKSSLHTARAWLALEPLHVGLREATGDLHLRFAQKHLDQGDNAAARAGLDWVDRHLPSLLAARKLSATMRSRAQELVKEAAALPPAAESEALAKLREARSLYPAVPDIADELAKRKKLTILYVAVPDLPKRLSPATAWTCPEKQALDLLFSRLTYPSWWAKGGDFKRQPLYRKNSPDLALDLPPAADRLLSLDLRGDRFWSDGRPVISADVRHTFNLYKTILAPRNPLFREFVEKPRLPEFRLHLDLDLRQELFDPLSLTRLHVLPEQFHDRAGMFRDLKDPTDPSFDLSPTGSGPFFLRTSPASLDKATGHVLLRANPGYPGDLFDQGKFIGEVRFITLPGPESKEPLPRPLLILGPLASQGTTMKKMGLERPITTPGKSLHLLAINHRRPALAIPEVRFALAHGIRRDEVLTTLWNKGPLGGKPLAVSASGPFPQGTWMHPPESSLKADPFPKGADRLHARQAAKKLKDSLAQDALTLNLLYPDHDPRIKEACQRFQKSMTESFAESGLKVTIELDEKNPHDLQKALTEHHYDLAWHQLDFPEDLAALWSLLDDSDEALKATVGGNFLGYRDDPEITALLRKTLVRQPFATVRAGYHKIHVHLFQKMPFIPLWHEEPPLAVDPSLAGNLFDPRQVFLNLREWKLTPK